MPRPKLGLMVKQSGIEKLALDPKDALPWGRGAWKIARIPESCPGQGSRLVLVTAMSPSPAGEGKTTVTIGLTDALWRIGERAVACLREPSMGPIFGMKGGGSGGGRAELVPADSINLHFTGDLHAVTSAHNLLAAAIDNHLHHGNPSGLEPRTCFWPRVLDVNDRSLRRCVIGLGGKAQGVPRETRFDITAASEVMAILALSRSYEDLRARLGRIIVGLSSKGPVTAEDLGVAGAMGALLRDAFLPNLVHTCEGNPALVHCGPFANIAHGTSSLVATRLGLERAQWVLQEAGFGADLGGQKFLDIFAPQLGRWPDLAVLVVTLRAIKFHGGKDPKALDEVDGRALELGMANPLTQLSRLRERGLPVVVALNLRSSDCKAEVQWVLDQFQALGVAAFAIDVFGEGGGGALELAHWMANAQLTPGQDWGRSLWSGESTPGERLSTLARRVYGADRVEWSKEARQQVQSIEQLGLGGLDLCMAKTQYSFSDEPGLVGAPTGFPLQIREVFLAAGAGLIVPVAGEMMRMPGLPRQPHFQAFELSARGEIEGRL